MNERIKNLREIIISGEHRKLRNNVDESAAQYYRDPTVPLHRRTALRLSLMLDSQVPMFLDGEKIAFMRTTPDLPPVLSDSELAEIKKTHFVHEQGRVCNLCPDYASVISCGLYDVVKRLSKAKAENADKADYIDSAIMSCEAVMEFADRYRIAADASGRYEIAAVLSRVPAYGASNFREALQFFRILHFALWCEGDYHNTVGRFDQFMYPYYKADIDSGRLTKEDALELIEEFFLTFNRDSDLYFGMQQGDNGQSMVLGGYDVNGNDCYNELSELCLTAALEMRTIDPKINLRVSSATPLERYEFASRLTEVGMGFPQYSNDDTVVKGLKALGYAPEDAANYVVAACWEFIIPGRGMDIPNIGAVCLPECVDMALRETNADNAADFRESVKNVILRETSKTADGTRNLFMCPAPFISRLFEGCTDGGRDISDGCVYNNYGLHGTGLANAADCLNAVETLVYGEKSISREEYIAMLDSDYEGREDIRRKILALPKFGSDEASSNDAAEFVLGCFSDACAAQKNERGGIFRAGTGSAMYYAFHGEALGATSDGRKAGEYLPANYSPAIGAKTGGPLNVVKAFASPCIERAVNGGPLTLELSQAVTQLPEKLAPVVMSFVRLGGHQLQVNAVDRNKLLDAEAHPERYRELVVRVWGWSGYYTSLDEVYRKQILRRTEYSV